MRAPIHGRMTQRALRILIISLFALILLGMIGLFVLGEESRKLGTLQPVGGDIGGAYTLINQNGETITDQTYAGSYKLIYFGFTYCPAICPTELAKMTQALGQMGTAARAIQPIFITIDPARDTQAVLKDYVSLFGDRLTGLTGTDEQIAQAARAYKVYYAKVEDEAASEYTMDHSSYIYFMSPDDRLLHIFRIEDTADQMAGIMQAWLNQESASSE